MKLKIAFLISLLLVPEYIAAAEKPNALMIEPLERIGIRRGEKLAEFFLMDSKTPFFVTGFNYIRLRAAEGASEGDHSTFDADTKTTKACYDANRAEAMFSTLSKGGCGPSST